MFEYARDIIDSGWISYGKYSQQFEQRFAQLHNQRYGILSNSGTSSLLVALQTLKELHGWKDGDEVIVPAVTFVATVNVVLQCGLKPVLVDVESDYYGIDVNEIGKVFNSGVTRAVIPVHTFGQPVNLQALKDLVHLSGLHCIEDSCESVLVGSQDKVGRMRPVGSWSDISCFSFYMAHLVTCGVGGMCLTNNPDYAKVMRSLVNHGMSYSDLSDEDNFNPQRVGRDFTFGRIGHSFRITEFEAAIGLAQLDDIETIIHNRQNNARCLTTNLWELSDYLQPPYVRPNTDHAFMMYPIVCKQEGIRDKLCQHLNDKGISTRRMLPLVSQPCYKGLWNPSDYPVARWIEDNGYYIGCHQHLIQGELDYVIEAHLEFF